MPATRTASARPTTRGIALTFDPRYVEWVIQAWLTRDLAPMKLDELVALATAYAEERLTELTSMGLHEEDASADAVNKAIALLKNLGLLQQRRVTPKPPRQPRGKKVAQPAPAVQMAVEPPYYAISATADGRTVLSEPPATGGIRVELVRRIVAKSPELTTLLTALDEHGPLIRPVRSLTPLAPTRGAAYARSVEEGIEEFWSRILRRDPPASSGAAARRPAPAKVIEAAAKAALSLHPAGVVTQADKLLPLASALGLVWMDTRQVNEVIGAQYVGSAASRDEMGFAPHVPSWEGIRDRFVEELVRAYRSRADSVGFATLEAIRGAIGHTLSVSPAIVDALLCEARDRGDQHELPILLQFEPNDDLLGEKARRPLVWQRDAYDLIGMRFSPAQLPVAEPAVQWQL